MATKTRQRDDVLAELAAYRHMAGRMTVADPDYQAVHGILNDLLDELQRAGA